MIIKRTMLIMTILFLTTACSVSQDNGNADLPLLPEDYCHISMKDSQETLEIMDIGGNCIYENNNTAGQIVTYLGDGVFQVVVHVGSDMDYYDYVSILDGKTDIDHYDVALAGEGIICIIKHEKGTNVSELQFVEMFPDNPNNREVFGVFAKIEMQQKSAKSAAG